MKIVVLADDLTGAAELGGIGYRFGFRAGVSLEICPADFYEMSVIDTNTRCFPPHRAKSVVYDMATQVTAHDNPWIYKKVDSVLRGPVLAEIEGILSALRKQRAFLAPANPSKGRVIRDGLYYTDGKPIDQTSFAQDPINPIRSSEVLQILGISSGEPVFLRRPGESIPSRGIVVCEASSKEDLQFWAANLDETTLAAGGAEFFEAILGTMETPTPPIRDNSLIHSCSRSLVVSGSALRDDPLKFKLFDSHQIPVVFMPKELSQDDGSNVVRCVQDWTEATRKVLKQRGQAVVAIGLPVLPDSSAPEKLSAWMARLVVAIVNENLVDHVLIEGGSTASEIVRRLSWTHLTVVQEWAPGVISLRPKTSQSTDSPRLTLKPGSYPWPGELLRTLQRN